MKRRFLLSTFLVLSLPSFAPAEDKTAVVEKAGVIAIADIKRASPVDFQKDVLPLFKKSCTACHNKTDAKGDLVLETPATILKGGESGPAVVPGKSGQSLLLKVASHAEKPVMPPKNNKANAQPLKPEELGLIKKWIDEGAKGDVVFKEVAIEWQPLPPGLNPVYAVAVSPDGQYVAAGRANQIFIYHVPTKSLVTRLSDPALKLPGNAHRDIVQSLTFNPQGDLLASGGYRVVKLWRRPADVQKQSFALGEGAHDIALSPDGKWLAAAGTNNTIKLYSLATGKPERDFGGHAGAVADFKFSADGAKIISVAADKTVRLFNVADGKQIGQLEAPSDVTSVTWLAKEAKFATGHGDNLVRVWETAGAFAPKLAPAPAPAPAKADEKPAEKTGDKENAKGKADRAKEKETEKKPEPSTLPAGFKPLQEIKLAAAVTALVTMPTNDAQFLAGTQDGNVHLLGAEGGKAVRSFPHGAAVTAIAIRSDGLKFASAGAGGAKLWKIDSAANPVEIKGLPETASILDEKQRLVALQDQHIAYYKKLVTDTDARKKAEADALTKANDAVKKAEDDLKAKTDAFKKAMEAKAVADKGLVDSEAAFKQATDAKTAADAAAVKGKEDTRTATAKATEVDAAFKKSSDAMKAAEKAHADAQAKLKAATDKADAAKAAFSKKPDDKALADALAAADKDVAERTAKAKVTETELAAAKAGLDASTKTKTDTDKAKTDAAARQTAADAAKAAADKAHADALNKKNAADQAVKAQDKPFSDAKAAMESSQRSRDSSINAVTNTAAGVKKVEEQLAAAQADQKASEAAQKAAAAAVEAVKKAAADAVKPITTVAFSGNGGLLVTGGEGQVVQTWNGDDGSPVATYRGHGGAVLAASFLPDGAILSAAAGKAIVWDTAAPWKLERAIGSGETDSPLVDRVLALAFSPDGKTLATGGGQPSRSGELKLWNVADGTLVREIKDAHSDTIFGVDFSFDGKMLASCAADKFVKTWTVADGKFIMSFEGHTHHVLGVSWMADGRTLASAGADGVVKVWDFVAGGQKRTIKGDSNKEITAIRFIGVSDAAITCSADNSVKSIKEGGGGTKAYAGSADSVYAAAVTPDGKVIAAGGQESIVRVWNAAGTEIARFEPPKEDKK
jgi:WD40 repeat protein